MGLARKVSNFGDFTGRFQIFRATIGLYGQARPARSIVVAIALAYGREEPHQICHFHLLWEYLRGLG